jgi:hypothetical protein
MKHKRPKKIQVMVATPLKDLRTLKQLNPQFAAQLDDLTLLSRDPDCPYEFVLAFCDQGLIPARNRLVENFLKSKCKWLLFRDYDVESNAAHVLQLLSKKLPVIGALYTTKGVRPHWVATFLFEAEKQKETVLQVMECGAGLKLYHRQLFENLAKIYPQISYTDRDTGSVVNGFFQNLVVYHDLQKAGDLLPEDYFCDYLCRMCRISVWVDTAVKLKHRDGDGTLYPAGEWPPIPGQEPTEDKVIHLKKPRK